MARRLSWDDHGGVAPRDFTVYSVPKRLARPRPDAWAGYLDLRQSISTAARRRLGV